MIMQDVLILLVFWAICSVLYLLVSFLAPRNRTKTAARAIFACFGLSTLLAGVICYMVFWGPFGRNWGLGGTYLWMLVCPLLYLLSGIFVHIYTTCRKGESA